jgi:hypothetical protein
VGQDRAPGYRSLKHHVGRELREARREARGEAIVFVLVAAALLVSLALTSLVTDWELVGLHGWVWLVLCFPEAVLAAVLVVTARMVDHERVHELVQFFLSFVVLGNLAGLVLLVVALLKETSADLSGAQLLASGAVVWLTNVIVFGLWFWTLDGGGALRRARAGRRPTSSFRRTRTRRSPVRVVSEARGLRLRRTDQRDRVQSDGRDAADPSGEGADGTRIRVLRGRLLLVAARAVNVLGS